jgi:hypothetical protein
MNIIETISNQEFCTDLVTEYFQGIFSRDEVYKLLYEYAPVPNGSLEVRRGVGKLAEEWNRLNDHTLASVENWYSTTPFYIFDLLPWNACSMFTDKLDFIIQHLEMNGIQKMVDYGGGLGITSMYIKERIPEMDITYVDFKDSHQFKFCEFLMKKLNFNGIKTMDVKDFMAGQEWYDAVLAMDCFEHIPNMDETVQAIGKQTNIIIHDSTFGKNEAQPQHVNDRGDMWFINLMLTHHFFFLGDPRLLRKFGLSYDGHGVKISFYSKNKDIYAA